jgi:hypothetical protein
MNSEDGSQESPEANRATFPPNEHPAEAQAPVLPAPTGFQPPPSPPHKEAGTQEPDEPKWRKNLTLALEIIGLIALVVYTCFAGCQWKVANDTLTEIRNSKADTNRIITASETQAGAAQKIAAASDRNAAAAEKFSASTDSINQQTQVAVAQFKRFADAASTAANVAKQNAKDAHQSLLDIRALSRPTVVLGEMTSNFDDKTGILNYTLSLINATSFMATNLESHCTRVVNKQPVPNTWTAPKTPKTVGPQEHFVFCGGEIGRPVSDQIRNGVITFDEYITATYDGPAGSYNYCEKIRYDPLVQLFGILGDCDISKPFPQ